MSARKLAALLLLVMPMAVLADPPVSRQMVKMPVPAQETLREEMLMNLQTVYAVEAAITAGRPADVAEQVERYIGYGAMGQNRKLPPEARPGMHMPEAMHALGRQLHAHGSELAAALRAGERSRIDGALRDLFATCVACHASYRLEHP